MGVQQHTMIIYIRISFEVTNTSTIGSSWNIVWFIWGSLKNDHESWTLLGGMYVGDGLRSKDDQGIQKPNSNWKNNTT